MSGQFCTALQSSNADLVQSALAIERWSLMDLCFKVFTTDRMHTPVGMQFRGLAQILRDQATSALAILLLKPSLGAKIPSPGLQSGKRSAVYAPNIKLNAGPKAAWS